MFQFVKTTALGGLLFLVPVIILITIFDEAHQLVSKLAEPISSLVKVERVVGFAIIDLLAIVLVVVICFLAGLAAKMPWAMRSISTLESAFLTKVPAYDLVKTKLTAQLRFEEDADFLPVLARFDDQWQIAFEMERLPSGHVVVYLPGAPDAWSGAISIVTADRVTPLDAKLTGALRVFKNLGKGAGSILQDGFRQS